jgi:hypothetical protein
MLAARTDTPVVVVLADIAAARADTPAVAVLADMLAARAADSVAAVVVASTVEAVAEAATAVVEAAATAVVDTANPGLRRKLEIPLIHDKRPACFGRRAFLRPASGPVPSIERPRQGCPILGASLLLRQGWDDSAFSATCLTH